MSKAGHEHFQHQDGKLDNRCEHECSHECKHEHTVHHLSQITKEPSIFSESYELTFSESRSILQIQNALTHWLNELLAWVNNKRGFVGHIKGFAEGNESFWFSSTGKTIQAKPSSGWSQAKESKLTISTTAIIFGIAETELKDFARESLQKFLTQAVPDLTLEVNDKER